jgi:hypothetical protein
MSNEKEEYMRKERTNIYITERQKKQLEKRVEDEGLSMAEIIRRALDAYLAWDDPLYQPSLPTPQTRKSHSSPP